MLLTSVELCAGAGGQALGLENADVEHLALVEIDGHATATLTLNRPAWNVIHGDLKTFDARPYKGATLVTGGLPCPPYSIAGKQLGPQDDRDLFGHGMRVIEEVRPEGGMLENVKGILDPKFEAVRNKIRSDLKSLGFVVDWRLLNASDFGVPQLRPRVIFVALPARAAQFFHWPTPNLWSAPTVGDTLLDLMAARGWEGAGAWAERADDIAPTLVGGSKKHGGADLGPTRSKRAWAELGVDGHGLANDAPMPGQNAKPRLTWRMAARIQGFPDSWLFSGGKTAIYRQIGNAFPPPVAYAVSTSIKSALNAAASASLPRRKTEGRAGKVNVI